MVCPRLRPEEGALHVGHPAKKQARKISPPPPPAAPADGRHFLNEKKGGLGTLGFAKDRIRLLRNLVRLRTWPPEAASNNLGPFRIKN